GRNCRRGRRRGRRAAATRRRRPRQGLEVGGTRGGRSETVALMARVLVAALVALIISILAGPVFIDFLRRHALGQQIREEGPEHHSAKQGTPTMGGVLIVMAASIAFLATSARTLPALTIFGTMIACGAIGFLDDLIKLRHRRSLGLSGRLKMVFLIGIAAAVGVAAHHQHLRHHVAVPILNQQVPLGWGW